MATKKSAQESVAAKRSVAKKVAARKAPQEKRVAAKDSAKSPKVTKRNAISKSEWEKGANAPSKTPDQLVDVQGQVVNITLALQKPNWQDQKEQLTKPLWQIAALAFDVAPDPKVTVQWKKLRPDDSKRYAELVIKMCDALLPSRKEGHIFYDQDSPANSTRIEDKKDLKYVRVEAVSATAFVIEKFGLKQTLPAEFRDLHEHLKKTTPTASLVPDSAATRKKMKSDRQDAANETKDSNRLAILLYVLLENKVGWAKKTSKEKAAILQELIAEFTKHDFKAGHGFGPDPIESLIEQGRELAPLKKE